MVHLDDDGDDWKVCVPCYEASLDGIRSPSAAPKPCFIWLEFSIWSEVRCSVRYLSVRGVFGISKLLVTIAMHPCAELLSTVSMSSVIQSEEVELTFPMSYL